MSGFGSAKLPIPVGWISNRMIKLDTSPRVRNIPKAMSRLSNVCGFWVEMPFKRGVHHVATPNPPVSSQLIARSAPQQQTEHEV